MFNAYYFGRHLLGIGKMPAVTGHGCASLDRCETYGFRSLDTAVPRWTGVKRVDSLFFLTSGKQQRDGAQVGPLFFVFFLHRGGIHRGCQWTSAAGDLSAGRWVHEKSWQSSWCRQWDARLSMQDCQQVHCRCVGLLHEVHLQLVRAAKPETCNAL